MTTSTSEVARADPPVSSMNAPELKIGQKRRRLCLLIQDIGRSSWFRVNIDPVPESPRFDFVLLEGDESIERAATNGYSIGGAVIGHCRGL